MEEEIESETLIEINRVGYEYMEARSNKLHKSLTTDGEWLKEQGNVIGHYAIKGSTRSSQFSPLLHGDRGERQ